MDDGGYRIKGQMEVKWYKIMLVTLPIGELGLSAGDKFSISWGEVPPYAGGLELYVAQYDADMKRLLATSQESQKVETIVPTAAYITCCIGISGVLVPVDCTVYPMLAKSDAPVDYYVPYKVGGSR